MDQSRFFLPITLFTVVVPYLVLHMLGDCSANGLLCVLSAYKLSNNLSTLKDKQCRNTLHAIASSDFRTFIHIHLNYLSFARIFFCNGINSRGYCPARSTPSGPKIHQYRNIRLQNLLVKTSR